MSPSPSTQESALEVAVDALTRRARILDSADPHVAAALRMLAANLEYVPARFWRKKDPKKQAAALAKWKKAREAWL